MDLAITIDHIEAGQQHPLEAQSAPQLGDPGQEKILIRLEADRLRYLDIVPMLVERLEHWDLAESDCQEMFVVLSELYNNALDHGILGLDSRMKSEIAGFIEYMELREKRLSALREGSIEIELEKICKESKAYVKLRVKDSGQGFRYNSVCKVAIPERRRHSGRGIDLVKTLCNGEVRYFGNGNEVVALYPLKETKK